MTTKSQAAFEAHYLGYHNIAAEDFSKTETLYNFSYMHRDFERWQAAEEFGRKQALEEARDLFSESFAMLSSNLVREIIGGLLK